MNLVFPAGSNSDTPPMCIDISIIDDPSTVEPDETFTVTLSTSSSVVSLGNNMTIVTITNAVESITEDTTNAVEARVADFNTVAAIGGATAAFLVLVIIIFIIVTIVFVKYRSSRTQKKGNCVQSKADLVQS